MKTYNDFLKIRDYEDLKKAFILDTIAEHKATEMYKIAVDADLYMHTKNPTIMKYKKLLYTISGEAVPDNYSADHKCASSFFRRFITQENQYLLGNGVSFSEDSTKDRLGGDDFDVQIQKAGRAALVGGLAFGFANFDHIDVFKITEFAPLWDENNGALMAGVRFWQIADDKPLRATLYEIDGYTEYIKPIDNSEKNELQILQQKRPYKLKIRSSIADGTEIYDFENYPTFPIVPLWGNPEHQSELVNIRSQIDAYDLIKSGFANDLDDASMIYWTISNAGGMDDVDLAEFVERMRTIKAAVVGDGIGQGSTAEAHTLEVPYQSREAYLSRLRKDMYEDMMALDTQQLAAGQITATQIEAAYEPLNEKTDMFEYCVIDFIKGILNVFEIEDSPTFTRSVVSNKSEELDSILKCVDYVSSDYVTKKLITILGDADMLDDILKEIDEEDSNRFLSEKSGNDNINDDVDNINEDFDNDENEDAPKDTPEDENQDKKRKKDQKKA